MRPQQFLFIQILVLVALLGAMQMCAQAGLLEKFFDERRVTRCPAGGWESLYEGATTLKVLNWKESSCQKHCQSRQLESISGSEQVSIGPKLVCCCKPSEGAAI